MSLGEIGLYAQVALGIGLVIFVHELGHFLAARLCGVRVEVFSLGFGPKLFGWRRGSTTYQLALLPLGGYVRMAGEERFGSDERALPDELGAKSVGQRFFIYSGGVLMNVVFGLVVFPLVLFRGVPFDEPLIGRAVPGGPAWRAGIESGTRVVAIDGTPIVGFNYIANEIALGSEEEAVLTVVPPGGGPERDVRVRPQYDERVGFRRLDVTPAVDPTMALQVRPGSAADKAGLRTGDRLVGVLNGLPGLDLLDQLDVAQGDGAELGLAVDRGGERLEFHLSPEVTAAPGRAVLGVSPRFGRVLALRENPDVTASGVAEGDLLVEVSGRPVLHPRDVERALLWPEADATAALTLRVLRDGRDLLLQGPAAMDAARRAAWTSDVALGYDTQGTHVTVSPGSAAAAAGLLDGDRIVRVSKGSVKAWEEVRQAILAHRPADGPLSLDVERIEGGQPRLLSLAAELTPPTVTDYGLGFRNARYVYRAHGLVDAFRVGVKSSWKFVVDAWLTLKRILFGQVSSENIGGIVTIAAVGYSSAEEGLAKLLFILCMLSMNLAFINVLPIPVLDGGHLFFLIVEKIKGSPVSERVLGYSQVVGLVLILSLMIYVTYNDLMRWVFSG